MLPFAEYKHGHLIRYQHPNSHENSIRLQNENSHSRCNSKTPTRTTSTSNRLPQQIPLHRECPPQPNHKTPAPLLTHQLTLLPSPLLSSTAQDTPKTTNTPSHSLLRRQQWQKAITPRNVNSDNKRATLSLPIENPLDTQRNTSVSPSLKCRRRERRLRLQKLRNNPRTTQL
ncbi:hypothetical protein M758_6G177100 [Ceratodon purpureus]|nr:hypothetical protein M758_6G177100 [Ceratodon purpureus]